MTAYSFGNRWVGIIALGEPDPPEPLHKMAIRLMQESQTRPIRVTRDLSVPSGELLRVLARVRMREAVSDRSARAAECLQVEDSVRAGLSPILRPWLRAEVARFVSGRPGEALPEASQLRSRAQTRSEPKRDMRGRATPGPVRPDATTAPALRIVPTGWAAAYPQAPSSPWLPPVSQALVAELTRLDLAPDDGAIRWLRWASVHRSYLYESVPESPLNARALDVLATLGLGWLRLALLDEIRSRVGEFASSADASAALRQEQAARVALGDWVVGLDVAVLGRGELALRATGQRNRASETVGMQILGALSLVAASRTPATSILRAAGFHPAAPEPDWHQLIVSALKREPTQQRAESGPDHDRTFTVTVEANGRTASATDRSVRAARSAAFRSFVQRHLPQAVPEQTSALRASRPRKYDARLPAHDRARDWACQAFEVDDAGLLSQALTHASWAHENRPLVARASQRDLSVLATEGAEVLTTLVRHQHALQTLSATFEPPTSAVTSPAVTREALAGLLDSLPLGSGVLLSKGLQTMSAEVKENVIQAVAGAAWRANGDRIFHRQERSFARWIRDFSPAPDPATQLQNYCARAKADFQVTFEERGAHHAREYRARITFLVKSEPSWLGEWASGKTAAKQEAAGGVLALLLDEGSDPVGARATKNDRRLVSGLFAAHLNALESQPISSQRAIAEGHLGADLLAAADYENFIVWASRRSSLLEGEQADLVDRLRRFLESVVVTRRRDAVRTWIARNTPSRRSRPTTRPSASTVGGRAPGPEAGSSGGCLGGVRRNVTT